MLQNNDSVLDANQIKAPLRGTKIRILGSRWSLACQLGGMGTYREGQSDQYFRVLSPPEISMSPWVFLRKPSMLTVLPNMPEAGGRP